MFITFKQDKWGNTRTVNTDRITVINQGKIKTTIYFNDDDSTVLEDAEDIANFNTWLKLNAVNAALLQEGYGV